MSTQVTLALSDEVYHQARRMAQLTSSNVAEVLNDAIELSLAPVSPSVAVSRPIADLPDKEILALTELQLPPAQDRHLSRLLDRQQAGKLAAAERAELMALMQVYQEQLLRKAQALSEAVRRGLIEPLSS
ncbi:MAG: hypothetical protein JNK38_07575 [Acidobacteria bacterium]|nr:hypothetical protein [Acidobacteriota bacterium]